MIKIKLWFLLITISVLTFGCLSTNSYGNSYSSQSQTLLIFGGNNHDVFLGSLNTNKFDSSSIWNSYGDYGSKFSQNSIWNNFSIYGSKFNSLSPWNEYSSNPPVIVDSSGNFYGYFTANKYHPKRSNIEWINWIADNNELIKDDVSAAYDLLFL